MSAGISDTNTDTVHYPFIVLSIMFFGYAHNNVHITIIASYKPNPIIGVINRYKFLHLQSSLYSTVISGSLPTLMAS